jgi:hypothetical protein
MFQPLEVGRIEVVDSEVAAVLRGKSGMERLRLAHEAWELARDRLAAFFRARHPAWSEQEIQRKVAARLAHEPS